MNDFSFMPLLVVGCSTVLTRMAIFGIALSLVAKRRQQVAPCVSMGISLQSPLRGCKRATSKGELIPTTASKNSSSHRIRHKTAPLSTGGVAVNRSLRHAFSLLEVIIATAILAASAVMLMSLFSTGDRHMAKADERTMAQMLCQSKLDELIADPTQIVPIEADLFRQYPGWISALDVQPTSLDGLAQVTVSVTRIPGMETGADLELATTAETSTETPIDANVTTSIPIEPTYKLTRWMKYEGSFDSSGASIQERSEDGSILNQLGGGF